MGNLQTRKLVKQVVRGKGPLRKKQIKNNGPSKDSKMKDLSNILNMRIFESDLLKKKL